MLLLYSIFNRCFHMCLRPEWLQKESRNIQSYFKWQTAIDKFLWFRIRTGNLFLEKHICRAVNRAYQRCLQNSGNENLRLSVLFFIIVMDSGSLKRSCARARKIAWLHIIRPTHLCLEYGREIVGPGSMTTHYCTKKENEIKKWELE